MKTLVSCLKCVHSVARVKAGAAVWSRVRVIVIVIVEALPPWQSVVRGEVSEVFALTARVLVLDRHNGQQTGSVVWRREVHGKLSREQSARHSDITQFMKSSCCCCRGSRSGTDLNVAKVFLMSKTRCQCEMTLNDFVLVQKT